MRPESPDPPSPPSSHLSNKTMRVFVMLTETDLSLLKRILRCTRRLRLRRRWPRLGGKKRRGERRIRGEELCTKRLRLNYRPFLRTAFESRNALTSFTLEQHGLAVPSFRLHCMPGPPILLYRGDIHIGGQSQIFGGGISYQQTEKGTC